MSKPSRFIKLITPDATYYVNTDDVNYVIIPSNPENNITINCNRGQDIVIYPDLDSDPDLDSNSEPKYRNRPIIEQMIQFWITTNTPDTMVWINPTNVSVITKNATYTVRFRNTARITCDNINCRGNFAM